MGGTFDPVHNGHLTIAEEARAKLDLHEIIFVPAGQPWLKSDSIISPAIDRLEMVRLAIEPYPYFRLSNIEVERAGPSYTVDTMEQLKTELGENTRLFFLMGWDCLAQLPQWHQIIRLIELCTLVAMPRPGYPGPDLKNLDKAIPGLSAKIVMLDSPRIDISATVIRECVAGGLSISSFVPLKVAAYIRQKRLYLKP
jgi:nicotinate-nucleotide adenylyltransferase